MYDDCVYSWQPLHMRDGYTLKADNELGVAKGINHAPNRSEFLLTEQNLCGCWLDMIDMSYLPVVTNAV